MQMDLLATDNLAHFTPSLSNFLKQFHISQTKTSITVHLEGTDDSLSLRLQLHALIF